MEVPLCPSTLRAFLNKGRLNTRAGKACRNLCWQGQAPCALICFGSEWHAGTPKWPLPTWGPKRSPFSVWSVRPDLHKCFRALLCLNPAPWEPCGGVRSTQYLSFPPAPVELLHEPTSAMNCACRSWKCSLSSVFLMWVQSLAPGKSVMCWKPEVMSHQYAFIIIGA